MTSTQTRARPQRCRRSDPVRHPRRRPGKPDDRRSSSSGPATNGSAEPTTAPPSRASSAPARRTPAERSRSATTPTTRRCWSATTTARPPVEFLLHAIAACLTSGLANIAAARGITCTGCGPPSRATSTCWASWVCPTTVRNGYRQIRVTFQSTATPRPSVLAAAGRAVPAALGGLRRAGQRHRCRRRRRRTRRAA